MSFASSHPLLTWSTLKRMKLRSDRLGVSLDMAIRTSFLWPFYSNGLTDPSLSGSAISSRLKNSSSPDFVSILLSKPPEKYKKNQNSSQGDVKEGEIEFHE